MSLINEALRKAQSQRPQSPELSKSLDAGDHSINYANQPKRFGIIIGLSLFIIILLGLIAGLVFVLLSQETKQITTQTAETKPEAPILETISESSNPENLAEKAPTVKETAELSESGPVEMTSPVVKAPVIAAEPDQKIIDWVEQSTVSGVRITSSSSKVLINNRGFSPGDSVSTTLDLKIFEIEAKRIILIDANGVKYVKSF